MQRIARIRLLATARRISDAHALAAEDADRGMLALASRHALLRALKREQREGRAPEREEEEEEGGG